MVFGETNFFLPRGVHRVVDRGKATDNKREAAQENGIHVGLKTWNTEKQWGICPETMGYLTQGPAYIF